jgi:putative endonuclease
MARRYLEEHGLAWIASNHRCRFGEIDLIMRDGQVLAFIEVRFRRSRRYGGASASVDGRKQRRLVAAARDFLGRHPTERPCRFDVVAIEGEDEIQWIKGAFDAFG